MADERMTSAAVAQHTPIHYSTVFDGGKTPVLCASKDMNTPATNDPRYVTCKACLELMTPAQREMRAGQERRYHSRSTMRADFGRRLA